MVQVATTEVSDPAAFARTQAGSLDAAGARAEAYARGNGSRFAESAEFFENLAGRDKEGGAALAEALANQGLQQSNLGNFGAAARLLARADTAAPIGDGVSQRLARNYHAINHLNQRDPASALAALDKPVSPVAEDEASDDIRTGMITIPLAVMINRESSSAQELAQLGANLTASERAAILDAQASELRGIAFRQQGKLAEAEARLSAAAERLAKVRDGRVRSTGWLRSEIEVERALVAEARGDRAAAGAAFDRAIAVIGEAFPESPALLSARARKAGFPAAQRRRRGGAGAVRRGGQGQRRGSRQPAARCAGCSAPISTCCRAAGRPTTPRRCSARRRSCSARAWRRPRRSSRGRCRRAMTRRARCSGWRCRGRAKSSAPRPRSRG